jgi:hypothetical protein
MDGRSARMPGKIKCFSWLTADIVASRMIAADMGGQANLGTAMK